MQSRSSDFAGAAAIYERVVTAKPDDRKLFHNLADALARQGASERAVQRWRRLTELDPQNTAARTGLARMLVATNPPGDLVATFERSIQLGPETGQLHFELVRAQWQVGRRQEAAVQMKRNHVFGVVNEALVQGLSEAGDLEP